MPEKKKKGRRAYLSDYVLNAAGEYVYVGDYYIAVAEGKNPGKIMAGILGLAAAAFAVLAAAGCLSTCTASGAFYVTIPYALAVILSAVCIYDSATIIHEKCRLTTHSYEKSAQRIKGFLMAAGVCSFVSAAGHIAHTVLRGTEATRAADILFFVACLAAAALCYLAFRKKKQVLWQKNSKTH